MTTPQLIVVDGHIHTGARPEDGTPAWVEALAVSDGRILRTGSTAEIRALAVEGTRVVELGGRFVMAGISDGHAHLGLGGTLEAFELTLNPTDSLETVLRAVAARAAEVGEDEWVVGGIIGSTVMDSLTGSTEALARLDAASAGHRVLLRDDSMHNRWLNTAAMTAAGVGQDTSDPEGGHYDRDAEGRLTGVFQELASTVAEDALMASFADPAGRQREAVRAALALMNSFGITSVQEAASMQQMFRALAALEDERAISAWVVTSTPSRTFIEPGVTGEVLYDDAAGFRSEHVRPDFVKFVLDGVPMTRTTAMLEPYVCHGHGEDPEFRGETLWTMDELVEELRRIAGRGLGAKLHATGDASVRLVLDAVEVLREEGFDTTRVQIAHTEYISEGDLPRFAALGVVADASPHLWYPGVIQESIAHQIPAAVLESSWPHRSLVESGAVVAAGSDWPCSLPSPSPWVGLESIVTRSSPLDDSPATLNAAEALDLTQAIRAFTAAPAEAMGLGDVTGRLVEGLSADFIVLDRDLFEVPTTRIHETQVLSTWFEGREVFHRA